MVHDKIGDSQFLSLKPKPTTTDCGYIWTWAFEEAFKLKLATPSSRETPFPVRSTDQDREQETHTAHGSTKAQSTEDTEKEVISFGRK